jgi:hypothetical protein
VEVRHDEGLAIRIDPEPCAGTRDGVGEASLGERTGQPLSCERKVILGTDAVVQGERKTATRVIGVRRRPSVVLEPGTYTRSLHGDRHYLSLEHPPRWGGPHPEGEEP